MEKYIRLMNKILFSLLIISMAANTSFAQKFSNTVEEYKVQYEKNIRKSRINGVYIPKDLEEAFEELTALSTEQDRAKFVLGDEDIVAERLIKGLGQWMIVNWNFYEGSRLSHQVKGLGLSHPDDIAELIIRLYHRKLNQKPAEMSTLVLSISAKRKKILDKNREILSTETRIKKG